MPFHDAMYFQASSCEATSMARLQPTRDSSTPRRSRIFLPTISWTAPLPRISGLTCYSSLGLDVVSIDASLQCKLAWIGLPKWCICPVHWIMFGRINKPQILGCVNKHVYVLPFRPYKLCLLGDLDTIHHSRYRLDQNADSHEIKPGGL